jgi:hypothetical protein
MNASFINNSIYHIDRYEAFHLALGVAPFHGVIPIHIADRVVIGAALAGGADVVAVGGGPGADLFPFGPSGFEAGDVEGGDGLVGERGTRRQCAALDEDHVRSLAGFLGVELRNLGGAQGAVVNANIIKIPLKSNPISPP